MTTLRITPGPKNARTDPATGLRTYRWRGRRHEAMSDLPYGIQIVFTILVPAALGFSAIILVMTDD